MTWTDTAADAAPQAGSSKHSYIANQTKSPYLTRLRRIEGQARADCSGWSKKSSTASTS